ncbi:lariat debranching enzyme [Cryptotrichosporon argae]
MKVAVQGCSHGSLTAIYDSIARYELTKRTTVDLLLLCGDFQALRSAADFASLAVPPKYHALGTFHKYYSGKRAAPLLTLVIGGNHEASNYMWELYHGGWLAPNIYYLGAAGSVYVDGLRIIGASGIYKDHDYNKGHFEKVPYDRGTLRSVYHIRSYDVAKLMQLRKSEPTVFLSHDWPVSIAKHGDLRALLSRKPFFRDEIEHNTLGSPPLLNLLKHIQPAYWFAAHLHVKFAAAFHHDHSSAQPAAGTSRSSAQASTSTDKPVSASSAVHTEPSAAVANPDEIAISDDDEFDLVPADRRGTQVGGGPMPNPDEIAIDDEFDDEVVAEAAVDESIDVAEAGRAHGGQVDVGAPAAEVANAVRVTKKGEGVTRFLALDKCGPGKDFIQFLDIPAPRPSGGAPRLTYDPHWLAITRAFHPYLSTSVRQLPMPLSSELAKLVDAELTRIREHGLLVPSEAGLADDGTVDLVWDKGEIEVKRVQRFWPTAPAEGEPGGAADAWYTNPQTEAFCGMLRIENKINPAPAAAP